MRSSVSSLECGVRPPHSEELESCWELLLMFRVVALPVQEF
ncbi:MAG: hypothetical protein QOE77_3819 [Blastocatellia bacterium]|jgi:hypothetical protein|nr:hypothetical protein [Blastocatellia bacterium]